MLPTKGHFVAQSLQRTLKSVTRNFAAALPLTDPLEDIQFSKSRGATHGDVKITELENGIKVATVDNGGAVSRVTAALRYGSRHEDPTHLGLSHVLKNAAFHTNNERSDLRTVREAQQIGSTLESVNTREMLLRNATFMRDKLPETLENIAPGITQPLFNSWDLAEVKAACKAEIARLSSEQNALNLELLHQYAYRTGLGNSLYCTDHKLGTYSPADLEEVVSKLHVGKHLTIVGCDVNHDELVRYTRELLGNLPQGDQVHDQPQKYFGGEAHVNNANGLTYVSLVSPGAGLFHENAIPLAILQRIQGNGPYMKWGSNEVSSRLTKAAKGVTTGPLSINSLNISYSDAGLFGFNAIAAPDAITSVVKSAVQQMQQVAQGNVSAEDFERAKTQVKAGISMIQENKDDLLDDILKQVCFCGQYTSAQDALNKVDKIALDDVTKMAKHLLSGKATLVATGDTSSAPYLDQLLM